MAYETGKSGIGSTVSAHYGPRTIGNQEGTLHTKGAVRELVYDFSGDKLDSPVVIPAGALIVGATSQGVASVATINLVYSDATTVSVGTATFAVPIPLTKDAVGVLLKTSVPADITPTAGKVVIQYIQVA